MGKHARGPRGHLLVDRVRHRDLHHELPVADDAQLQDGLPALRHHLPLLEVLLDEDLQEQIWDECQKAKENDLVQGCSEAGCPPGELKEKGFFFKLLVFV